jgi:hypothetical protein
MYTPRGFKPKVTRRSSHAKQESITKKTQCHIAEEGKLDTGEKKRLKQKRKVERELMSIFSVTDAICMLPSREKKPLIYMCLSVKESKRTKKESHSHAETFHP